MGKARFLNASVRPCAACLPIDLNELYEKGIRNCFGCFSAAVFIASRRSCLVFDTVGIAFRLICRTVMTA